MQSIGWFVGAGPGRRRRAGHREMLMAMRQLDVSLRTTSSSELEEQERLDAHKAAMIVVSLSLILWVEIALLAHWLLW